MEVKAKLRYLHMSPRKVRRVAKLISGMSVPHAQAELLARPERSAEPIGKLLKSAIANAHNLSDASEEGMKITSVTVTEGPRMKRFRPVSRGMAHPYMKRMSHVNIVLDVPGEKKKSDAPDAPVKIDPSADKREDTSESEEQSVESTKDTKDTGRARGDSGRDRKSVQESKQRVGNPSRFGKFFRRKSM